MTIMTNRIYTSRNSSAREFIGTVKEPTLLLHFGGSYGGSWIGELGRYLPPLTTKKFSHLIEMSYLGEFRQLLAGASE